MEKIWMKDGKFSELTAEQMKDFTAAQLGAYAADKNTAALKSLKKEMEDSQKEYIKDVITKDEFAEKMSTILDSISKLSVPNSNTEEVTNLTEELKDLTESMKTIGLEVKALKEGEIRGKNVDMIVVDELSKLQINDLPSIIDTKLSSSGKRKVKKRKPNHYKL